MKLPIPAEVLGQHVAILGKTRSGKSSVMRLLVEDLLRRHMPVCIVDPKGDWWGIKLGADGKSAGFPVVIFGGEHADVPINATSGAGVADLFATDNRPCLIDLGGWMPGDRTRFWIDFASALFRHTRGQRWLAVDEFHNFAPKGKVLDVDAGKMLHWSNRIASEGLGKGLRLLFASQRPQKVHNDSLTSAETLIAMRVIHKADRDAVADWIKGAGDSEGKEVLATVAQMARGEGWAWSPEVKFGPERVKFPMFSTYDSFREQSVEETKHLKGWAEVDLADVTQRFAAAAEQAKNEDPKLLRAEIGKLRGEMRALERLHAQTMLDAPKAEAKVVEKPVLKDGQFALAQKLVERADGAAERMVGLVDEITNKLIIPLQRHAAEIASAIHSTKAPVLSPLQKKDRRLAGEADALVKVFEQQKQGNRVRPRPDVPMPDVAGLGGPARKILNSLAWWEALNVESPNRTQVAVGAGYSPTGSAFRNPLSALSSAGLVRYPRPDAVRLTGAGRDLAQSPGPATQQEVFSRVEKVLTGPEWKILAVLIDAYPNALTRDQVAEGARYSAEGSAFRNPLSHLSSLGLVEYPSPGEVAATSSLFLEGR
jgi:hypothetical protein